MFFKDLPVSHHKQLLARARKRYVQFSVYGALIIQVTKEVQLIRFIHTKRNDDHIALAALEAFHRIHHDVLVRLDACFLQLVLDECYLVSVGRNDSDIPWVEIPPVVRIHGGNGTYDLSHDLRLRGVCFR